MFDLSIIFVDQLNCIVSMINLNVSLSNLIFLFSFQWSMFDGVISNGVIMLQLIIIVLGIYQIVVINS